MALTKRLLRLIEWTVVPENVIGEHRDTVVNIGLARRKGSVFCTGFMCQWFYELIGSHGMVIRCVAIQELISDEEIVDKEVIEDGIHDSFADFKKNVLYLAEQTGIEIAHFPEIETPDVSHILQPIGLV